MVLLSKVGRSDETLWNFFAIARGFSKCGRTGGETYRSRWASEISRRHSLKSPNSSLEQACILPSVYDKYAMKTDECGEITSE